MHFNKPQNFVINFMLICISFTKINFIIYTLSDIWKFYSKEIKVKIFNELKKYLKIYLTALN